MALVYWVSIKWIGAICMLAQKKQSTAYIQVIYTLIMCSLCHQGSVGRSWHPINSTMAHQGHINVSVMVGFSDSCRSSRQGQRLKSTINLLELVPLNTQPNKPATQLGHHVFTSVFSCYLFLRSEILTHPAHSTWTCACMPLVWQWVIQVRWFVRISSLALLGKSPSKHKTFVYHLYNDGPT